MTHAEIENRGWVEAYVRHRLAASDAAAFEEHYFQCDRCFAEVETMEKFLAGVHDAGRRGLLNAKPVSTPWLMPAFAFAGVLSVLLGVGVGFLAMVRLPQKEASLQQALAQAKASQARVAELDRRAVELDRRAAVDAAPQANVPVAILEASRGAETPNRLLVDAQARTALLWIDVPSQPPGQKCALTISTPEERVSTTIHGLVRNQNGALAASLPLAGLPDGRYVVRLYPDLASSPVLAEYRLTVVRK